MSIQQISDLLAIGLLIMFSGMACDHSTSLEFIAKGLNVARVHLTDTLGILIGIVCSVMAMLGLIEVLQWVVQTNLVSEKSVVIHQVFETPNEIDQNSACMVGNVIDLIKSD